MKSINPHNNEIIQEYSLDSNEQILNKIQKSNLAFQDWKKKSFKERAYLFNKISDLLEQQKEKLAKLMAQEMGKPLKEGISEIEKCAWVCRYYAENAENFLKPETIQTNFYQSEVHYKPLGAIFAIMPWNFPFWQVFRFAAPTLMAGNTSILKHAETVTGCALAIESLFQEAGFPQNVFQIVVADINQAQMIIEHNLIQAVTLTGSTRAGKAVASLAGSKIKKTVLELGGSDAYLVLEDANLDKAINICTQGRFLNAGQSCISPKRIIVHQKHVLDFQNGMLAKIKKLTFGDPLDPLTNIGPLARKDLRDNLAKQVQKSIELGANCLVGGTIPNLDGFYYPPTLLVNVTKGMPAFEDELFGPVTCIITAPSDEEAIQIANNSRYGLAGGIFSENIAKAKKIAIEEFESGACFINDFAKSDPRLPFGGIKESGYGRELSHQGIKEFVNTKTICVNK